MSSFELYDNDDKEYAVGTQSKRGDFRNKAWIYEFYPVSELTFATILSLPVLFCLYCSRLNNHVIY